MLGLYRSALWMPLGFWFSMFFLLALEGKMRKRHGNARNVW